MIPSEIDNLSQRLYQVVDSKKSNEMLDIVLKNIKDDNYATAFI
jgi:hypothetical protein